MRKTASYNRWFTLIELLIVISIIWILSIWVFVPYNLYSNIAKVRLSREIMTQTLSEARNSAAWLVDIWTHKNQNIALFINKWDPSFSVYSFPYDYSGSISTAAGTKIKDVALEDWVNINSILDDSPQEKNNVIIYFTAPEWIMHTYKDSSFTWSFKNITIWFWKATTWVLSKTLEIK